MVNCIGFLNKLIYYNCVFLISTWLSWLSWRYNIFIWVNILNLSGNYDKKLPLRSNFIKPMHFVTTDSYVVFIFVPAKISNFKEAGYFIKVLICSYYSFFFFVIVICLVLFLFLQYN